MNNENSRRIPTQDALELILAGNSTFTVRHLVTGNRRTFKVRRPEASFERNDPFYYVYVLTGADNENSYSYMGCIRNNRYQFPKNKTRASVLTMQVFERVFYQLLGNMLHPNMEIWHEGKCARCGRKLTVPESIETGFGPECSRRVVKERSAAA
jgi:DNA-directed RNA polymerase subunit RPC12/RpoP